MLTILEVEALPCVFPGSESGNNAVVVCGCGKPFLFSSMTNWHKGATCPYCHKVKAMPSADLKKGKKIRGPKDITFVLVQD